MPTEDAPVAAVQADDSPTPNVRERLFALRRSHDRLLATLDALGPDAVTGPSYCDDWTIAQVCSHLGSGAEISLLALNAAIAGEAPPGNDVLQPIWDIWNALAPSEQVARCIVADRAHVEALEAMTDDELAAAHITMFGMLEVDGFGLAGLRLGEHAVHTWDIAVELDPAAHILPDAVEIISTGTMLMFAGFIGRPQPEPWSLAVRTTDANREYLLTNGEAVTLAPIDAAPTDVAGELLLPAEALVRLVFGRLDAERADGIEMRSTTVSLDELRLVFAGF